MPAAALLFDNALYASCIGRKPLASGQILYCAGDEPTHVYRLRSGLLIVSRTDMAGQPQKVGFVRAGEWVGEMAVLAGSPRSSTVTALRDSVLEALPASLFLSALDNEAGLACDVAQLVAKRSRTAAGSLTLQANAKLILISAIVPGVNARGLADALAGQCRMMDKKTEVFCARHVDLSESIIMAAEGKNDIVLVVAEHGQSGIADTYGRHVDRRLLLSRSDERPDPALASENYGPLAANGLVDLVLERYAGKPSLYAHAWLRHTDAAHLYHIDSDGGGVARLARILTGGSIGLALSGGGARAFAHIGAVRALREAGIAIDLAGGTSMGAIVAAGVASGWDDTEMDHRMRAAFVESSPLDDVALPIVAMTRGRKVERRLAEHFGDIDIADLALPFFAVSTNLTSGHHRKHDRGSLTTALRASISLPGILPPVIDDNHVLVDGGVLRNLPTDIMRNWHDGKVIGSDVTRSAGLEADKVMPPRSWLRWFASGAWRRGPPIVSILMRSGTIGTSAEVAAARAAADLYVMPDTGMVEIRDWHAYPQAVEAGYRAMQVALEKADGLATMPSSIRQAEVH